METHSSPTARSRRIGWLADLETLARNPQRLAELQERLGVDTVWLESGRYHTAGYQLPDEVWKTSPFQDWRVRPGLSRHRQVRGLPETAFPVLPGVLAGADDTDLWTVIEAASRLGVDVWGHMGLWSYGGMVYPELALQDLAGLPIPAHEDRWGAGFCPSKPALNDWLVACVEATTQRYPLQGIEVDHARYPPPQSLPNLLACACPDCSRQAAVWEIDLPALVKHLQSALERIQSIPASDLARTLQESPSFLEALDALFLDGAASRWLNLRAKAIAVALQRMSAAARHSARGPFLFGIDVFPPSVALLGGHCYADLDCLDYFTGGFGTIGWERVGAATCLEWSRFLLQAWPGLDEALLLAELYRLFGFDGLDLPLHIDGLATLSQPLLARLEAREIKRMVENRPRGLQVYPPASLPALGEAGLEIVCQAIAEGGLDGIMIAGLEILTPEQEQRVAFALKSLA